MGDAVNSVVFVVTQIMWTLAAIATFVIGYLEGHKRRTEGFEVTCSSCGVRAEHLPSFDAVSKYVALHKEWHDRQEAA